MVANTTRRIFTMILLILILPSLVGIGCNMANLAPGEQEQPSATPLPEALVLFRVELPDGLEPGDSIYLTILDEVTGLALNPVSYVMEAEDPLHYELELPLPVHSVVKYRYQRQGKNLVQEHMTDGRPVRYRLYHVEGPGEIEDVVSRWTDTAFEGITGRIQGRVMDAETDTPLTNVLAAAGGVHTLTTADGSFVLEGLPPGIHNLVAYTLDGSYRVYQQGALVAEGSATPAPMRLEKAPLVKIDFLVSTPGGTIPAVPIHLAGNLYQLGNTFADLGGGISALAVRMPTLTSDGRGGYTLSLELPAGADVRYKYTIGDGLWNAEHASDGSFRLRRFIVPEESTTVEDRIETWSAGGSAPITFDITVPSITPQNDNVSIQFNPGFGWTEPIPMWNVGGNRWIYVLYSPLETLGDIHYRYCRNDQCGSADDVKTVGNQAEGLPVRTSPDPETISDKVEAWLWLEDIGEPTTLPNVDIRPRGQDYMAGIEIQPSYHPSWGPRMANAFSDVASMNANWLILTPSWTFTRLSPPVLELLPGVDLLWHDLSEAVDQARSHSLNLALYPTPHFPGGVDKWWAAAPRDFPFWVAWFERYRTFLLHHADLAASQNARALIIGGEWLAPALPGGLLANGSASNVPADAETRWRNILEEVRSRYDGELLWALPYPQGVENPPPFLDAVDRLYVLWSAPLSEQAGENELELAAEAALLLDTDVAPLQETSGKPVVIGLAYPSVRGWLNGCVTAGRAGCIGLDDLSRPNPDIPEAEQDLAEQAKAYNAMLLAVNERDWIVGVVSRGYYPPAVLHDKSASIHGKPTRDVLWYWFSHLVESP